MKKAMKNFIRPLSLLYAGGVIGKVKNEQGRSALVMKHRKDHKERKSFEATNHIWLQNPYSKNTCLQGQCTKLQKLVLENFM